MWTQQIILTSPKDALADCRAGTVITEYEGDNTNRIYTSEVFIQNISICGMNDFNSKVSFFSKFGIKCLEI